MVTGVERAPPVLHLPCEVPMQSCDTFAKHPIPQGNGCLATVSQGCMQTSDGS